MIAYFKKYTVFVCIIAVALPIVASTVWPLVTGQLMAASVGGLVTMFALFVVGLFIGYGIFERKAEGIVDGYLAHYNDECDPDALISEGGWLADAIAFPCNQMGSWFMGYYAQALLDAGRADEARKVAEGLDSSMRAAKSAAVRAGILVNLLPLAEKLESPQDALGLLNQGLEWCDEDNERKVAHLREFLLSQKKVLEARAAADQRAIASIAESIVPSGLYPMRIRVEYAWDEASAHYKLGNAPEEKRCLEFVAKNGNKLALAAKARERLASVSAGSSALG